MRIKIYIQIRLNQFRTKTIQFELHIVFYLWCFQFNDIDNEIEKLMQFVIYLFSHSLL